MPIKQLTWIMYPLCLTCDPGSSLAPALVDASLSFPLSLPECQPWGFQRHESKNNFFPDVVRHPFQYLVIAGASPEYVDFFQIQKITVPKFSPMY